MINASSRCSLGELRDFFCFFIFTLEPRDEEYTKSMRLKYKPASTFGTLRTDSSPPQPDTSPFRTRIRQSRLGGGRQVLFYYSQA